MVPSFLPATLILPKALGRLPAIGLLGGAIEEELDRLAAGLLGENRADFGPGSGAELAAEAAADVVHLHLDIGGGNLEIGRQSAGPSGDELRGGPGHHLVALPLNDEAVRFQAAVRDDRNAVGAIGDGFGILEGFFGIAGDFFAGRFAAGAGLAEVGFIDEVRHHFVIHLDLADGFARDFFGGGGHGGDFLAVPLEFCAGGGDHVDRFDAVHLLGGAGIDRGDAGMAVRAGEVGAVQQILHLEVRGVLGAAGGLLRTVEALEGLADDLAGLHRRPAIVRCVSHFSLPSYSWRLRGRPGGHPYRCRSGRGCRRVRASRLPWWGWGVRKGSPWWP